jgi:glutamate/aspartate transport system permease protein
MAWDLSVFCQDTVTQEVIGNCLKSGEVTTYLWWLLTSWGWTLALSGLALAVALAFGTAVGILRTTPHRAWVLLGEAWTELFRNVPLIVQLFLWYFVVPKLVPPLREVPGFAMAMLGLGFFTSARISEQVKAGIRSLPTGQRQAALALGLTLPQAYRHVLLPRALRIVMPPLTSESMNIVKNSAVAFAVSVPELTMFARQAGEETSRPLTMYLAVTVLYFVSALFINRVLVRIEARLQVPGMAGSH